MQTPLRRPDGDPVLSLAQVLESGGIHSAYQPIVDLAQRRPVGYEALARGPVGSPLERPDRLFAEAARSGLEAELEWECRRAAMRGALDSGLGDGCALFINLEPSLLSATPPQDVLRLARRTRSRMPLFVELTERALTDDPPRLLAAVDRMRQAGIGVVLDDVGADPRSLALLPYLRPDVIKLDLSLTQGTVSREIAAVVHAVNAQAERSGAVIVAEGIETEEHLLRARALGARFGQGWLFDRPGLLPAEPPPASEPLRPDPHREDSWSKTPFDLVTAERPTERGSKRLLIDLSLELEAHAEGEGSAAVVLAAFEDASFFTPDLAARYEHLAERAALVGALGAGLSVRPTPLVRGSDLTVAEPLRGEWNVIVTGPHFAAAFVAKSVADQGSDRDRSFDFALTYDRDLALRAARAMMRRLARASES